jgi:4-hydroxybenzoate polyprenyltransferase/phosphoserine phosphatase
MTLLDFAAAAPGAAAVLEVARPASSADASVPLCVDLDGTLIRSDLLVEGLLAIAVGRSAPRIAGLALGFGRAALKRNVARTAPIDAALLPYNEELLAYLRGRRAEGQRLVLVTAADALAAQAVDDHLGLFDEIIASDGTTNLKGENKANALVARFGERGFDYAGDGRADLAVWRHARGAILVNAAAAVGRALERAGGPPILARIGRRAPLGRSLLRAMRPRQWVKNLLVFVPLLAAWTELDPRAWNVIGMFLAFCATASAIYLVNDLADLSADRRHPRKRYRAIASGALPLPVALAAAAVLLVTGFGIALAIGMAAIVAIYAVASISYSLKLKEYPLIDVFMLGGLYTIRLVGGGAAIGHPVSVWLAAFSGFLFLSLALMKRSTEIAALSPAGPGPARRGYFFGDVLMLQMFGSAATFASVVVLALYVGSDVARTHYLTPQLLWLAVPLLLFWQCRLWLSTARGHMNDDPIVYASRDWVTWLVALCGAAILGAAAVLPVSLLSDFLAL